MSSSDGVPPPDGPLRGWLQKKGVKGPAKTWKRRWFQQEGGRIDYYVSKDDTSSKMGTISLDDVISVHPTSNEKRRDGKAGFRLNTPQRIYNLMADNEELMSYWVNGLVGILKEQTRVKAGGEDGAQLQKKLEGVAAEKSRLEKALALACEKAGVSVQSVLAEIDGGASSNNNSGATKSSSASNDANDGSSPATTTTTAAAGDSADKSVAAASGFQTFRAKVLYDFTATRNEQLSLSVGDIITVEGQHEGGWWSGVDSNGSRGFFPGSYLSAEGRDDD
jgi:Variant SH3 domain/PH domain